MYIDSVLVAVNANFWRAYSNFPIGPTIIDGELVEMRTHKNWTSGFFDAHSRLFIDNFFISGKLFTTENKEFEIRELLYVIDDLLQYKDIFELEEFIGYLMEYWEVDEIDDVYGLKNIIQDLLQEIKYGTRDDAILKLDELVEELRNLPSNDSDFWEMQGMIENIEQIVRNHRYSKEF